MSFVAAAHEESEEKRKEYDRQNAQATNYYPSKYYYAHLQLLLLRKSIFPQQSVVFTHKATPPLFPSILWEVYSLCVNLGNKPHETSASQNVTHFGYIDFRQDYTHNPGNRHKNCCEFS